MVVQTSVSVMLLGMNKPLAASAKAAALFGVFSILCSIVFMPVSGLSQGFFSIVGYTEAASHPRAGSPS